MKKPWKKLVLVVGVERAGAEVPRGRDLDTCDVCGASVVTTEQTARMKRAGSRLACLPCVPAAVRAARVAGKTTAVL